MREVQLRHVKATLSSVVDRAIAGEPTIITRHGRKDAVLVSFDEWERVSCLSNFANVLPALSREAQMLPEHNSDSAVVA